MTKTGKNYKADGFDALLTMTCQAIAGATTLVGGTVSVTAVNTQTKVEITGMATIVNATAARMT